MEQVTTATDGQSYCRLQTTVTTNQLLTTPPSFLAFGYAADIFFFCGNGVRSPAFLSDPLRCVDVLDISSSGEDSVAPAGLDFRGSKPSQLTWSAKDDWDRYGSIIGGIKSSLTNHGDAHLHELGVHHARYVGSLDDAVEWQYYELPTFTDTWAGLTVQGYTLSGPASGNRHYLAPTGFADNGLLSFGEGDLLSGHITHSFDLDAWDVATILCDYLNTGAEVSYTDGYWRFLIRNYTGTYERGSNLWHIEHSYEYEMRYGSGPYVTMVFHVTGAFTFRYSPVHGSAPLFSSHRVNQDCFSVNQLSSAEFVSVDWPHDLISNVEVLDNPPLEVRFGESPWGYAPTQLYARPFQRDYSALSNFEIYRRYHTTDRSTRHRALIKGVLDRMSDIRPSSFYSSANALEQYFEVIKANNVENLSQLGEIFSLLPDLSQLPRIASKVANGDPSAILDLIDVLSDALLKFRFAQAPTTADAREILQTDIRSEVESLIRSQTRTIYGKFRYEFPWEHNFSGDYGSKIVLETRSKLRIYYDASTLMTGILAANSAGLLPTLSRVWETMPFTFVVDWFTNMSSRLKKIDDQVSFLTLVSVQWALHSYKVTYYPSDDELDRYGLYSPQEPFGVSMYIREFTRYTPVLKESRYDFLAVTGLPNLATVGALLWQIL